VSGAGAWDIVPWSPLKAAQPSSALTFSFLGLTASLNSSWSPGADCCAEDQCTLGSLDVSSIIEAVCPLASSAVGWAAPEGLEGT